VRIVATPEHNLQAYMKACVDAGLKVLLVIARESLPMLNGQQSNLAAAAQHAAQLYQQRYDAQFDALQVCNEPDGQENSSSWVLSPDQVNQVIGAFRAAFPGAFIVGPGLASGNPSKFDGVDVGPLDAIAVHPYGQGVPAEPGLPLFPSPFDFGGEGAHVGQLLDGYRRFGKPIWVTEWGISDTDMADEAASAAYVRRMMRHLHGRGDIRAAIHFCWGDNMVPKFGLHRDNGSPKPAFDEYVTS